FGHGGTPKRLMTRHHTARESLNPVATRSRFSVHCLRHCFHPNCFNVMLAKLRAADWHEKIFIDGLYRQLLRREWNSLERN
ncbi:MAG: hypothetical protein ACPHAN_15860, partial [Pseudomonadales bacterium]